MKDINTEFIFTFAVAEPSYNEDDYNDFDDYSEGQSFLR